MNTNLSAVIRGKTSYAKILGDPVPNYEKTGREWKFDLQIDDGTVKEVKALGIGDRVKSKDAYLNGAPYLSFRQKELRRDGTKNGPIKVVDINGQPWPQDRLIGNGSTVDVRFAVVDFGVGKKKGIYVRAVRVLDHVPFERPDFDPVDEKDEFFEKAKASAPETTNNDLDEDMPF